MEDDLGYVVISCHSYALGLIEFNGNNDDTSKLLNNDIKKLIPKSMKGLILECCNAGHLDYIDIGNVATSFASVVNGAPVMASDGTVFFNSLGTSGYENRCSSVKDLSFDACCIDLIIDLNGEDLPDNYEYKKYIRQENKGWVIYRKIGSQITYNLVDPSEYIYYDSKQKNLTFSKMLQLISS